MDLEMLAADIPRLAPPSTDPAGARVASLISAARTAAIAELVRTFGQGVSRAGLLALQMTHAFRDGSGMESAKVVGLRDRDSAREEFERDGRATVDVAVDLSIERDPVGVAILSFGIER